MAQRVCILLSGSTTGLAQMVRALRIAALATVVFSTILPCLAEKAKTTDLISVSGSRALRRWKINERQFIGGKEVYAGWEQFELIPRRTPVPTIHVVVSIRGIPEADLFLVDMKNESSGVPPACSDVGRHSSLRFEMTSTMKVAYGVCFPAEKFEKAQGEIIVAVDDADPERFSVSFERQEGFFESPLANALLSPALAAIGGIVAGTVIGYLGFVAQQRYLRKLEQMKAFRERKLQAIRKLRNFFKDTYPIYRNPKQDDELVKVKELREILIESDVYALMAPDEIGKLNQICDAKFKTSRLDQFDRLMAENFSEFLTKFGDSKL
jgi:hypothetical protein